MTVYEEALKLRSSYGTSSNKHKKYGLLDRTYNVLSRRGFCMNDGDLDRSVMLGMVRDGSIWDIRGIGPVGVKQICDWLEGTKDESEVC